MLIEENNGEFIKKHSFSVPFSPQIYQSVFTSSDLKILQELAENSRKSSKVGEKLSGNIQEQRVADNISQEVLSILAPHIQEYVKFETEHKKKYYNQSNQWKWGDFDYRKLNFSIDGIWFNYMTKNEFNPLHQHSGLISGILMIKVPKELSQEPITIPLESNARCPGMLEWVNTGFGAGFYRKYPVEGEIYLFPAELKHQVYPFASDVERITASFNISEINFGQD
mgnify:CR=1 FL=1|tara:strand:+ start:317 stop:991 length:675 start_codon:yes stop_codon:yes gene_type:complete